MLLAGGAGLSFSQAHTMSLGVMIGPLEQSFGWTRAQISAGLTIAAVIAVTCAPFMGMLIDRVGPRRIVLLGLLLYSSALAGLSLATSNIWSWWGLWVLLSIAHLHIKPTAWVTAVTGLFAFNRGLALGVLLSVAGLGAIVTPPLTLYLVQTFGWRVAYMLLVCCWGIVVIPIVYFLFTSVTDRKRLATNEDRQMIPPILSGVALKEGFSSGPFRKLALAAFLMSLVNTAIQVNLVPILASFGRTLETAAAFAGMIGVAMIVGRLGGGYLMDRIDARIVVGTASTLPAVFCVLVLMFPGSLVALAIGIALLGIAMGAENDGLAYLAGRYFGLRNFGALFGSLAGLITLGLGVGPVLANYGYDSTGSYEVFLWGAIPAMLVVSGLFYSAGRYPPLVSEPETNLSAVAAIGADEARSSNI